MKHNLFVRFFAFVLLCLLLSSCTAGSGTGTTAPGTADPATAAPTTVSEQTETPDRTQDNPSGIVTESGDGTSSPAESGTAASESTEAPQQTTSVPETGAPVTTSAIQTTDIPAVTTKTPEITTRVPEITTKTPEITTQIPVVTTRVPEVTTKVPVVTTGAPAETTRMPIVTDAPEITTKAPEVTTQTPGTTAAPFDPENPDFPEADYHGEVFTVYAREASTYSHVNIFSEERNGDTMDAVTTLRNWALEKTYNIHISPKTSGSPSRTLKTDIGSGYVDYDAVLDQRINLSKLVLEGLLGDWNSLGIHTEAPWWDANCARGYNIGGKIYMAANDVSISNLTGARFVYFNAALADKYGLENPYDLVDQNRWTLGKFTEMCKAVTHPSAEAGGIGEYGILLETGSTNGTHMQLLTGFGNSYVKWEDGGLRFVPDQDDINLMQKMGDQLKTVLTPEYTLGFDDIDKLDKNTIYNSKYDKGRANFAQGHFLFLEGTTSMSTAFAGMAGTCGAVPNPRYTSDQENYYHKVDKYSLIWAFPEDSKLDRQRLATVMDYWAFSSSQTVMDYYLRTRITDAGKEDEKAVRNLYLVKNSIVYELGDMFGLDVSSEINTGYESNNLRYFFPSKNLLAKIHTVSQQLEYLK